MAIDFTTLLGSLAEERPLFHSEADFQHALAWHVRETNSDCDIRLEFKPFADRRIYLDIWLPSQGLAIELKYKTRGLSIDHSGETFTLLNQSAQDIGRYDFLKDVQRLEEVVSDWERATAGLAILLTNDSSYWNESMRSLTVDTEFRVHQGRLVTGNLSWLDHASEGTRKGREKEIKLNGSYALDWRGYSDLGQGSYTTFRYLALEVLPPQLDN